MSFFPNAQNTPIQIQDAMLTAVGGDQHNHTSGSVTVAGNQNIYHGSKGAPLRLHLLFWLSKFGVTPR